MRKFLILVVGLTFLLTPGIWSEETEEVQQDAFIFHYEDFDKVYDPIDLWKKCYEGDYKGVVKAMIQDDMSDQDEFCLKSLVMVYFFYRRGDGLSMNTLLESMDRYVEYQVNRRL